MATEERASQGLKSIRDAREKRERSGNRVTPQHVLFVLITAVTVLVIWKIVSGRQLDAAKDKLLQKQRAVQATVGAEWAPLRDKIEKMTLDAATGYKGDFVDSVATTLDFRSQPGIYLRIRLAEARDAASLRKAAQASLKDSFVGCLLREPSEARKAGDLDAGLFPDQPWNLRQAYASTRILTDDWVREVKDSDDDLRLRVFEQQYDKAARDEIPLAVEMIKRAQFFLLVLDEDTDAARDKADGGPITEEALQLVPHDARVTLVSLKSGNEVFRLRRAGQSTFYMAGDRAALDPGTLDAMQRNVNNCDLANKLTAAILEKKGQL
jgi:hypothetical protein